MVLFAVFAVRSGDRLKERKDLSHSDHSRDRGWNSPCFCRKQQVVGGAAFGDSGVYRGWIIYPAVCGDCAVFYPFFLCRTIGAGDIKLMGVVTGFLGVWDGMLVIGLGMVFAAAAASYRMIKQGTVWFRLERAARFAVETGMKGRLTEYPGVF